MRHFDLVIIGTGSGNSVIGPELDHWDIAIVEAGLFGGTCLNAGCIPTKMFVHPADLADGARRVGELGVTAHIDAVNWPGMRDRIFGRIDPIEAGGRRYRQSDECPNVTVYEGFGTFTGMKKLEIARHDGGTETITADRFVLAAGSHAVVPELPGIDEVTVHTSDTVMRIDDLPASVVVIGSGYIAAEFCHVFASFGSRVTQISRGPRLLGQHDRDISDAFTRHASERYDVRLSTQAVAVRPGSPDNPDGVTVEVSDGTTVPADLLLVAIGREPNGHRMAATLTGVEVGPDGRVIVDEYQRTAVDGIWALGDISTEHQLKHVANHEARIVAYNLVHPDAPRASDHRFVPGAVFSDPQIASVGLTERQATERGVGYVTGRTDYSGIAAGWAREDTTGFLKVLADPDTGMLIGAHVIGPEAATVIQPLIQAMSFGQSAHEVARGQYWIHPALTELIENALLALPRPTADAAPGASTG